ncbi:MAG: irgA [Proteobacteria bacterium]|nr:irgA [Pseudomonadota bacterium]
MWGGLFLPVSVTFAAGVEEAEGSYFEDLPTVLTVSRLPQPLNEAPGAVTVIDRAFIQATGYRDLARIFRLVPGMQVGQERGSSQWVTYHGLSGTNPSEMQVLIDGRSVYTQANYGGVDWTTLPVTVDEIERIEIVRGSNPVSYGANAFLGVINIITRHSSDEPGTRFQLNAGGAGIRDVAARTTAQVGALSMRLNAQHQHDHGFTALYDGRDVNLLDLRGDYRVSTVDELGFRVSATQAEKDLGYPDSANQNNALHTQYSQNYSLQTQWTHVPKPGEELQLHFYRNQERLNEQWYAHAAPYPPYFPNGPYALIDANKRAVRDHAELQHRFTPGARTQAVWGLEIQRDEVHAPALYAGRETVASDLYRGFGSLEWKFLPSWQLTAGGALEKFEDEPLHFAPRTFINWQASRSNTFRAGYARAWTQRPTYEKESDVQVTDNQFGVLIAQPYVPNPDLHQSRVDSVELGYLGRFSPLAASLDVRVFREKVTGFIYRQAVTSSLSPILQSAQDSAQYQNAPNPVMLTGVEYQLKFSPWHGGNWLFNHAVINTKSIDEDIQRRVAPYTLSLSWQQNWGAGWSSMITGLRMGPMAGGDGIVPIYSYVAPAYNSFDARIAYTRRSVNGKKVEYSLNAINLGEHHQEIADRSQQSLRGSVPANVVSPMVYVGMVLEM